MQFIASLQQICLIILRVSELDKKIICSLINWSQTKQNKERLITYYLCHTCLISLTATLCREHKAQGNTRMHHLTHTHTPSYTHNHSNTQAHPHVHTHTHTHTHTHSHTHTLTLPSIHVYTLIDTMSLSLCLCLSLSNTHRHTHTHTHTYIYIYIYHHVVPPARISLTISHHFSLSFIASGRSSGLHPVSSHSCCM